MMGVFDVPTSIHETCGMCGSQFDYLGMSGRSAVSEWRREHRCRRVAKKRPTPAEPAQEKGRKMWDSGARSKDV
jgi:hypothetical protein